MKSVLLFVVVLSIVNSSFGQFRTPSTPHAIPAFTMQLSNGQSFSSRDIKKNKPFVLIYFAPDCDHCIVMLEKLFKKVHQLDKTFVVLITFKPLNEVRAFETKYNIARYPNIKVGTEGYTYVVRNFYKLEKTPFTALYDKTGKLVVSYRNDTPVDEMLSRVKKLT
jgi:thiol-disulfide isomerase/thioredoxin